GRAQAEHIADNLGELVYHAWNKFHVTVSEFEQLLRCAGFMLSELRKITKICSSSVAKILSQSGARGREQIAQRVTKPHRRMARSTYVVGAGACDFLRISFCYGSNGCQNNRRDKGTRDCNGRIGPPLSTHDAGHRAV